MLEGQGPREDCEGGRDGNGRKGGGCGCSVRLKRQGDNGDRLSGWSQRHGGVCIVVECTFMGGEQTLKGKRVDDIHREAKPNTVSFNSMTWSQKDKSRLQDCTYCSLIGSN